MNRRAQYHEWIESYDLSDKVREEIERIDCFSYEELGDLLQVLSYKIEIKAMDEIEQGRPKLAVVLQNFAEHLQYSVFELSTAT